jgi:hypothetical protein
MQHKCDGLDHTMGVGRALWRVYMFSAQCTMDAGPRKQSMHCLRVASEAGIGGAALEEAEPS